MAQVKLINWAKLAREMFNYETITSFGNDFDIADAFGVDAIRGTFSGEEDATAELLAAENHVDRADIVTRIERR